MIDKIYERTLVGELLPYLDSPETLVIYGARPVGKTSLLWYVMKHHLPEKVFYFDLELRELLELCARGAEEVYQYLLQRGAVETKKIYLIIDEIQYLGNVFETFVFLELLKAGKRIQFWRTSTQQEIDFIIPDGRRYAIEAKLNFDKAKTGILKFFSEKYGGEAVTVGLQGKKYGKYVWELLPLL